MLKKISYLKSSLFLFSAGALFYLQPVKAGKIEYDIPCEEQTFTDSHYNRQSLRLSHYTPEDPVSKNAPSILFLHGGPGIKNEGQFDQFISQFTMQGFNVYVPEIIGSSYYEANGMDANEYKKIYCTDIQATIDHIKEKSSGDIYGIAHSLGCHQLFHFISQPESTLLKKVSAIAGSWDMGANRLYSLGWRNWKNSPKRLNSICTECTRFFVGPHAKLENDEKPMASDYNPVVTSALNKRFSVLYNVDKLPKVTPIQLIHAEDDSMVAFSLSLAMYKALKENDHKVSGYFISTGDHGFIKSCDNMYPDEIERLENTTKNILNFFREGEIRENSIFFDDTPIEDLQEIPLERDALKEHKKFLKHYSQ